MFLLLLGLQTETARATSRFEEISVSQGLPHNCANSIVQDNDGFLWIGTLQGLARYDGYGFKVFRPGEGKETIGGNRVYSLAWGDENQLWVGLNDGGVDRLDLQTGNFEHFTHKEDDPTSLSSDRVRKIIKDREGHIWIATDDAGLNRLDPKTSQIVRYRHDPDDPGSLSSDNVRTVLEDAEGRIWVGTKDSGLNLFVSQTGTFLKFRHDADDPETLSSDAIQALFEDSRQRLWIGAFEGHVSVLDRSRDRFTRHDLDESSRDGAHAVVRAFAEDKGGDIWIGTEKGVFVCHSDDDRFSRIDSENQGTDYYMSDNSIRAIFEDGSGLLWFGTLAAGLAKFNRRALLFEHIYHQKDAPNSLLDNMAWALYEDSRSNLWVGTTTGVTRLDKDLSKATHFVYDDKNPSDSIPPSNVTAFLEYEPGVMFLGTYLHGLTIMDERAKSYQRFTHDAANPSSISDNSVSSIFRDSESGIWIGTYNGGLNLFDPRTGAFRRFRHETTDPGSIGSNRVTCIHEDTQNNLWIGTSGGGLNLLDREKGVFQRFTLQADDRASLSIRRIQHLYESSDGTLWIATDMGLGRFDRKTKDFEYVHHNIESSPRAIFGILEDERDRLWMSSNKGLIVYDTKKNKAFSLSTSDGLQSDEFIERSLVKSPSGKMCFGGRNGLNCFYPNAVSFDITPSAVNLISVKIFDKEMTLDTPVTQLKELELSHRESFLSFEFTVFDYHTPQKNRFSYKLEGFDKKWIDAGTRNFASYTNLPGGEYVFRLKGANHIGIWSSRDNDLKVEVVPPFYETRWFYLVTTLLGAALVVLVVVLRTAQAKKRERKLSALAWEQTNDVLKEQVDSIKKVADTVSSVVNEILEATTVLSTSSSEVATSVSETTAAIFQMQASGATAKLNASEIVSSAKNTEKRTERGQQAIQKATDIVQMVKAESQQISEGSQTLIDTIQDVTQIVSAVEEISKRSKILAVNASIEAAKAGRYGTGFGVVAREIKSMALQSTQALQRINKVLSQVQTTIETIVKNSSRGNSRIEEGALQMKESSDIVTELSEAVHSSSRLATVIDKHIVYQTTTQEQIGVAMDKINGAALENYQLSTEMRHYADRLSESMTQLTGFIDNWHTPDFRSKFKFRTDPKSR